MYSFVKTSVVIAGLEPLAIKRSGPDLVAGIVSGDLTAEEELVRRYRSRILTVIRYVLGRRSEAEDLVHDCLIVAIAKVRHGDIREPEHIFGFLCSLARNVAIAHLRKADIKNFPGAGRPADSPLGPFDQLIQAEQAGAVHRVLAEMRPPRDRELLYRFYIAEEAKDSICDGLGLSSSHFDKVLHRARQRFRVLYQLHMRLATQAPGVVSRDHRARGPQATICHASARFPAGARLLASAK